MCCRDATCITGPLQHCAAGRACNGNADSANGHVQHHPRHPSSSPHACLHMMGSAPPPPTHADSHMRICTTPIRQTTLCNCLAACCHTRMLAYAFWLAAWHAHSLQNNLPLVLVHADADLQLAATSQGLRLSHADETRLYDSGSKAVRCKLIA